MFIPGAAWASVINSSGCGYGKGFSSTPSTTLKTAVLAPMPRANVRMATEVNIGERISLRRTCLSCPLNDPIGPPGCYEQNRAREQAADQQHPKTKYAPAWAGSSLLCLRLKQGAIMAANPIHRITVEEFRRLPESTGDYEYELHYGELVPLSRPKLKHHILQAKLRNLLRPLAPSGGWLDSEVAFRALPEYDFRVADVAFVSPERWKTA